MAREYRRYEVKVNLWRDGYRIDVCDNFWNESDYAFCKLRGLYAPHAHHTSKTCRFNSYSDVASDFVERCLGDMLNKILRVGCGRYVIVTDGVHGKALRIERW